MVGFTPTKAVLGGSQRASLAGNMKAFFYLIKGGLEGL